MNFAKVYSQARNVDAETEAINPAAEGKLAAQHLEWYKSAQTIEFLETLEKQRVACLDYATAAAIKGLNEKHVNRLLIQADTLKQIIDYARTNRRIGSGKSSNDTGGE